MTSNRRLLEEALQLVAAAGEAGLTVRLAGSAAVLAHAPSAERLYERDDRRIADIDLVTVSKVKNDEMEALLTELGYEPLAHHNVWHGDTRQMFDRADGLHVDVFRDELNFCHPISLKKRLDADHPTIPLAELLLAKLQIVEVNEKDLQDVSVLLLDHEIGAGTDELDADHVARTLGEDWGFWYTATTNLDRLDEHLGRASFDAGQRAQVARRAGELAERIEAEPKSARWRMRARIGTRKRWYQEVEEAQR